MAHNWIFHKEAIIAEHNAKRNSISSRDRLGPQMCSATVFSREVSTSNPPASVTVQMNEQTINKQTNIRLQGKEKKIDCFIPIFLSFLIEELILNVNGKYHLMPPPQNRLYTEVPRVEGKYSLNYTICTYLALNMYPLYLYHYAV